MSDDLHKLAGELVDTARLSTTLRSEAISIVFKALHAAYTDGMIAGTRHSSQAIGLLFEAIEGARR